MNGIEVQRKKAGLTQIQLAEAIGVTQANVSIWENGKSLPTADKLKKISEILKCSIEDLFKKENEKQQ